MEDVTQNMSCIPSIQ